MSLKSLHIILLPIVLLYSTIPCYCLPAENDTASAFETAPIIFQINIDFIDTLIHHQENLRKIAKNCLLFSEGERFSASRLSASIKALERSNLFKSIAVDSQEIGKNLSITFTLEPYKIIKDIHIKGEYPLFERDILAVMSLSVGNRFIANKLSEDKSRIVTLFKQEGYINPYVTIAVEENPDNNSAALTVTIKKGSYYTLETLRIKGNRAFADAQVKTQMKSWRRSLWPGTTGRFLEKEFSQDIKSLLNLYRHTGYVNGVVSGNIIHHKTESKVDTEITINEGPLYDIQFSGNNAFTDGTLKDDLILFEEGNRNNFGLKKSIKKIKERYYRAGYLEAQVTAKETPILKEDEIIKLLVTLTIKEGPQILVDSITITGNNAISDEEIKRQVLTGQSIFKKGAYIPEVLEEDVAAIKAMYLKRGYINPVITSHITWKDDKTGVNINIDIQEKTQTIISSITFKGLSVISTEEAKAALMLTPGSPFRKHLIRSDENSLSQLISQKGYPHVTVKSRESFSQDNSEAFIVYVINEGPAVTTGDIHYIGNFRTQEAILEKEFALSPGSPFSLTKMLEGQRNIRNLGIFDTVFIKTFGLKEKSDTVNLLIDVKEKKPYLIQLGGGYDSKQGFFAQAEGGNRNVLGKNIHAWTSGSISQTGQKLDAGLTKPRLFDTQITTSLNIFAETQEDFNKAFGTRIYGTALGFAHKWTKNVSEYLSIRLEQREQYFLEFPGPFIDSLSKDELTKRSIIAVNPSLSYDSRNSFIRPREGIYALASVDISKGIKNSFDDFLKYQIDLRYYYTPHSRLTFAFLSRLGYIHPFGHEGKIPEDQLFFLGGTSDVRGFNENMLRYDQTSTPVGGRIAINGSLEARIDIGRNFEFTTFYDIGSVQDTFNESGSDSFRSSVGGGIRYITPIGPVSLVYGHKLDRRKDESSGRFHFSIGYTF